MPQPASATDTSDSPLLGPDDPLPFEIVNPLGHAPILIVCDHASRRIPAALGDLGLDPGQRRRHIAWDIGAADVARDLAVLFDAPAVLGGYSRLIIDLNRFLDQASSVPEVSDGTAVPGNQGLSSADRARRSGEIFYPYHARVADQLDATLAKGIVPMLVSVHSFTPVMDGFQRPWHVGVLWESDARVAKPLMANLNAIPDLCVGDNKPYSAMSPEGYTMRTHATGRGLPHALLEIRQDLIDTRHGAAEWAERLHRTISPLVGDPEIHQIREPERP